MGKSDDTRDRLLQAAVVIFADRGYRLARVADICESAGVNLAAVNYHFGGKKELYFECLGYGMGLAERAYPQSYTIAPHNPQAALARYIRVACVRIFDEGNASLFPRLFVKELAEPTEAMEYIKTELFARDREYLQTIVRHCLGQGASDEQVAMHAMSVISLIQFFNFTRIDRQMSERWFNLPKPPADTLIEHTIRFALSGLSCNQSDPCAKVVTDT